MRYSNKVKAKNLFLLVGLAGVLSVRESGATGTGVLNEGESGVFGGGSGVEACREVCVRESSASLLRVVVGVSTIDVALLLVFGDIVKESARDCLNFKGFCC